MTVTHRTAGRRNRTDDSRINSPSLDQSRFHHGSRDAVDWRFKRTHSKVNIKILFFCSSWIASAALISFAFGCCTWVYYANQMQSTTKLTCTQVGFFVTKMNLSRNYDISLSNRSNHADDEHDLLCFAWINCCRCTVDE